MGAKGIEMCLGLVLVLMLWHGAQAQSGCTSALLGLSPCLSYVTGNASTPSQSCCTQLDSVVKSTPQCLCTLVNGAGVNMGFSINQTLALTLPGACNVQTPPISQCNAVANGPASSPAVSPAVSPAPSPSSPSDNSNESPSSTTTQTPTIPSGTESKTVPSTSGNTSDGNLGKQFNLNAVILFLAALAAILINF